MYEIIKRYESFSPFAYLCPAKKWTIGYGTTVYPDGTPVKKGDMITEQRTEQYMNDYIEKNIRPIFKRIPYVLTSNQERALECLIYNIGAGAFLRSKLFVAIKEKNYAEICRQWDFGFKQNLKGLFKRRTEELYLFMKGI